MLVCRYVAVFNCVCNMPKRTHLYDVIIYVYDPTRHQRTTHRHIQVNMINAINMQINNQTKDLTKLKGNKDCTMTD